jgi:hypothetical protein
LSFRPIAELRDRASSLRLSINESVAFSVSENSRNGGRGTGKMIEDADTGLLSLK